MASNIQYKCPNCGGGLTFNSSSQNVVCEYCDAEFNVNDVKKYNEELSHESEKELDWGTPTQKEFSDDELASLNVYHCESCGGELICDENTSATQCPYCGNHVILKGRLSGTLKPDYVIPFKNTRESLQPTFTKYLKKKFFLPRVFKTENKINEIKGLYVPFWLHDADVKGRVRFKGIIKRTWTSGDYKYTEKKYYSIIRDGSAGFDHIPVDGSKNLPDDLMESIEPFHFSEAVQFEPIYLSGFLSDKYDVNKEDVLPRATTRVKQGTVDQFRTTVSGYDELETESTSLELYNTKVSYALYPVWIMTTTWREKRYTFAMNGETNKIVGNLPMSKLKYFFTFLIIFLLAGAAGFAIAHFLVNEGQFNFVSILVGIIVGLIPSLIVCHINRKALKPVKLQHGASDYYRPGSLNITHREDKYLYKTTTRTKISSK